MKRIPKSIRINLESAVFIVAVFIYYFFISSSSLGFFSLKPHPYVLLIIIQTLRYGTQGGFYTTVYAIVFYLLGYSLAGNDVILFFTSYKTYKILFIFIFISSVIGREVDKELFNIASLKDKLKEELGLLKKIKEANKKMNLIIEVLRKRLISKDESIEILNELDTLAEDYCLNCNLAHNESEILNKLRDFFMKNLVCSSVEIYDYSFKEKDVKGISFVLKQKEETYFVGKLNEEKQQSIFVKLGTYEDPYQFELFTMMVKRLNNEIKK